MGSISTLINQPVLIDFPSDFSDNGWSVSDGVAYHTSCNAGYIKRFDLLVVGKAYTFTYKVSGRLSGGVRIIAGTTLGTTVTTNGIQRQVLTVVGNNVLQFYSDGTLAVSDLVISEVLDIPENGVTLGFNESANLFTSYLSFNPEMMCKFIDGFFAWKDGVLWQHNVSDTRNNFYDVQYTSKIIYYINIGSDEFKNFFSLFVDSNKAWQVNEAYIFPSDGKANGMTSRIRKNRFRLLKGKWCADFLRNMNDPRFTDEVKALFNGAELQGKVMRVTIENDDVVEVRLVSVIASVSP